MDTCELEGCDNTQVNACAYCGVAICMEHSYESISDEGHDTYACPYCYEELIAP